MTLFTVHVPRDPADSQAFVERTQLVPESFSWRAFFLGPLWLAWNRLWFALLLWVAASALLWLFGAGRLPLPALLGFGFLVECLLGLEGNSLVASALRRRGLVLAAVVTANGADVAERIYFQRSLSGQNADSSLARSLPPDQRERDEFVGLSPDAGG